MTLNDFHNTLRILLNIDKDEFVAAGCDSERWPGFRDNPHMTFIRMPTAQAEKLWTLVEDRQRKAA